MGLGQGGRADREGWLTRGAASAALGVSVKWVRNREGDLFHPKRGDDGAWYFDPREVEAARALVPRDSDTPPGPNPPAEGDLAARLFPLFEARKSWSEIIVETKIAPAAVRACYWEWRQGFRRRRSAPAIVEEDDDDEQDIAATRVEDAAALDAWEKEMRAANRDLARGDRDRGRRFIR